MLHDVEQVTVARQAPVEVLPGQRVSGEVRAELGDGEPVTVAA